MKSGWQRASSCCRQRRSSHAATMSWRVSVRSSPGFASTRSYRFETDEGSASLPDLFRGRSQLLIYHFMFGPDYTAGCPACSAIADGFNGSAVHLANHDVTLSAVSRAPLAKLQAYKRRMGWTLPVGLLVRQRLQLRLQRGIHRAATARRRHRLQLPPRASDGPARRRGARGRHAFAHDTGRRRRCSRRCPEPTRPPIPARGRA